MKILILTGKFGLGHWSASLSLRQQLLQCFPRAQVEVEDLIAYALPETSDLVYKGFHWLVTRGSGLFNLYYKLTQDVRIELRPACEGLLLSRLNRLLEERCPDCLLYTSSSSALLLCCSPRCRSAGSPSRRKTLTPARASSEPRSSPQLSRRFRKFPAWKAAMAPSAAAVTSCRRGFARVSPAAKTPGRLVRQPSSART